MSSPPNPARHLIIFTDGVARGNPGEAGFGVIIKDKDGNILEKVGGYLGIATNNFAEYSAMIAALKAARKYNADKIEIYSDSELMVRQLNGVYRVRSKKLLPLFKEVMQFISAEKCVTISHIPREKNKEADTLANKVVDKALWTK